MFGKKEEKKNRILEIARLLRTKKRNQRQLAVALGVDPSTVLDDITHAQRYGVFLFEEPNGELGINDECGGR